MTALNLWLDSYDDIYSDFDSRHYLKRRISEDFLYELRKEMRYTHQEANELVLLLPQEQRDQTAEKIIATSLTNLFAGQYHFHQEKCRRKLQSGFVILLSGIVVMLLNAWLSFRSPLSYMTIGLKVLLEPAAWFLIWSAFDFLFYDFVNLKKERNFYRQLSGMGIHFKSA